MLCALYSRAPARRYPWRWGEAGAAVERTAGSRGAHARVTRPRSALRAFAASSYAKCAASIYLGRGVNFPVALERRAQAEGDPYVHARDLLRRDEATPCVHRADHRDMKVVVVAPTFVYAKVVSKCKR